MEFTNQICQYNIHIPTKKAMKTPTYNPAAFKNSKGSGGVCETLSAQTGTHHHDKTLTG